ncbi:MAG: nucleotide exchange factor GrpE [Opitutaceae bacterium]|nr:nucleotide exchange factor GrpE [Opitutaceae bacterium]
MASSKSTDPDEQSSPPASADAVPVAEAVASPEPSGSTKTVANAVGALGVAQKEAADNYDRYVRVVADLENFRRRGIREKEELRLYAASRVLEDLLPVLDNLSLGLAAARQPNADLKTLTGGVEMVGQQLKAALASHGLKEIDPVGQPFDPQLHEAISHQASALVKEEHVLSVVRTGFILNGRLLRPATVVVSSGPAKKTGATT